MSTESLFWLAATLFWTMLMSFYSTQEMACISFNKLRLEYYVVENKKWALWLHKLLANPTWLFSTTLIGVNVALMASSECSRQFYDSIGLNPNLAPLTQVPFVLLFGELIPMFAARIYSEHVAKLGIPLLYATAILFSPISKLIERIFHAINVLVGRREAKKQTSILTREEIQKLIEERDLPISAPAEKQISDIIGNIFSLRNKQAHQLMTKLVQVPCISTRTTIGELRSFLQSTDYPYIPVYHKQRQKILGILLPRDLLDESENKKVRDFVRDVSFVSENSSGFDLFKLLQRESPSVALVVNAQGLPVGIVTIDDLLEELFFNEEAPLPPQPFTYFEKSFPASVAISDFNEAYGMQLNSHGCETFDELIEHILGRNPTPGDELFVDPVEIIVKETSLFKAKTILIRTKV